MGEFTSTKWTGPPDSIEVRRDQASGDYLVRDGKHGGRGAVLAFSPTEWEAHLAAVRDGMFGTVCTPTPTGV